MFLRPISSCEFGIPIVLGTLACAFASAPDVNWLRAPATEEKSFKSPEAGVASLARAVRENRIGALSTLIGDSCGAAVADFRGRKTVANASAPYTDRGRSLDGDAVAVSLSLGPNELPLHLSKSSGAWRFDAAASCDHLLKRRIRDNESSALKASREFAGERRQTASMNSGLRSRQIAPRDGYYYTLVAGAGPQRASAISEPAHRRGTALVAYPASYGVSGVMTFVVDHAGKIYKKDLGPSTLLAVLELEDFYPDTTWQHVKAADAVLTDAPAPLLRHENVSPVPSGRRLAGTHTVAAQQ